MADSAPQPNLAGSVTMRGEGMNRIETFVAAAFAFAVTMLVISVGSIPQSFEEFVLALKTIPAFAASFAVIVWIWHAHATWCRRYGLEDGMSIFLSSLLVFLVLIYIYPLRLMMQSLFHFLSDGALPFIFPLKTLEQARFMFTFYGIGFLCVGLNFIGLYRYALRRQEPLALSPYEVTEARYDVHVWVVAVCISLLSLILAWVLPAQWLSLAGFTYFLLFPCYTVLDNRHRKALAAIAVQD
ncbi:TMEM175 family protein [Aestuariibacter halophilus]|uniref:TMEM175 family protein n=1 Tax=Fluctibacter halophilus TaxID=226011 RepID=A0ABS8G5W4_9ALTE|nr:TMEM175 family protein [Aestuariibacter halophilus]MCC2615910.1 TMEM175 family protein [Aestuariibacter halophilus]